VTSDRRFGAISARNGKLSLPDYGMLTGMLFGG